MKFTSLSDTRKSQILLYGGLVLLFILITLGISWGRAFYIRYAGTTLTADPSSSYILEGITPYRQDDIRWQDEPLANSRFTLGSSGGLVSCIASSLGLMDIITDPSRVNDAFLNAGVFNDEGEVLWKEIEKAYPNISYRYTNSFTSRTIADDLKKGLAPILKVKYKGSGVYHWVLVIGYDSGEFMTMDPLGETPEPLSTHGKAYAYRVLVEGHERE